MLNVTPQQMPTVEELLALDLLTLREHTERAGDRIDPELHAAKLRESLGFSRTCVVRREGKLVAYAMLNQVSGASWFVRGFSTHPQHRSAPVLRELLRRVGELAQHEGIAELRSNVYKTNRLSMAFHRRLGFRVTHENAKGVEFFATVEELTSNPPSRGHPKGRFAPLVLRLLSSGRPPERIVRLLVSPQEGNP